MTAKPLNIMFYDSSDWAGKDLRTSWVVGGALYKLCGKVDLYSGFQSWFSALQWLLEVSQKNKIASIQFWGHGTPGNVWINESTLSLASISINAQQRQLLQSIKNNLDSNTTFWFRSCNVFTGKHGQLFAKSFSNFMNCKVAGHTFIIGPWQSGLHTITPGQQPTWPIGEGMDQNKDGKTKLLWSKPWSPNTITCMNSEIPEDW